MTEPGAAWRDLPNLGKSAASGTRRTVFGVGLHEFTFAESLQRIGELIAARRPSVVVTANLNYAMMSRRLPELRAFNPTAALVVADGMPLVWAARWKGSSLRERVTGADLLPELCRLASARGWRVFFLGSDPETLRRAGERLLARFPELQIVGNYCPSFPDSPEREREAVEIVRAARPDLLFIAATQPNGELWLSRHLERLNVPVSMCVGGTFNYLAGRELRAPAWLGRLGLEWLYRLLHNPRRLWPRYSRNALFFLRELFRASE